MSKAQIESLSKLIARLEDWQNRDGVKEALTKSGAHNEVNSAKSILLRVMSRIDNGG